MNILLFLLALALSDIRSWNWTWEYDYDTYRFERNDWSINPKYAAFNALELLTSQEEQRFSKKVSWSVPIAKRIYWPESRITLDLMIGGSGWAWALHDLPGLGYDREFIWAYFGNRFHLFVSDHADYEFHNYPIRK